jgi:hypothetical protein
VGERPVQIGLGLHIPCESHHMRKGLNAECRRLVCHVKSVPSRND